MRHPFCSMLFERRAGARIAQHIAIEDAKNLPGLLEVLRPPVERVELEERITALEKAAD